MSGLEGFDEGYDVGMLNQRQIRDFGLDELGFFVGQFRFGDHFHGVFLPRLLLHTLPITLSFSWLRDTPPQSGPPRSSLADRRNRRSAARPTPLRSPSPSWLAPIPRWCRRSGRTPLGTAA